MPYPGRTTQASELQVLTSSDLRHVLNGLVLLDLELGHSAISEPMKDKWLCYPIEETLGLFNEFTCKARRHKYGAWYYTQDLTLKSNEALKKFRMLEDSKAVAEGNSFHAYPS